MEFLFDLLKKALTGFVDSFKLKNPQVFVAVVVSLLSIYLGLGEALGTALPDGTPWVNEAGVNLIEGIRTGIVFLLSLFGAHTPQSKLPTGLRAE